MINRYGADTVRLFAVSDTPPHNSLEWKEGGVEGMHRFLKRVWRSVAESGVCDSAPGFDVAKLDKNQLALRRKTHETIQKVSDDVGRRHTFNTAIAAMMELYNDVSRATDTSAQGLAVAREAYEALVLMLSPMSPHVCQQLWQELGHEGLLINHSWPVCDETALVKDELELAVQVNGKLRGQIVVPADADKDACESMALNDPNVQRHLDGLTVRRVIVVPGRLVNIVAN